MNLDADELKRIINFLHRQLQIEKATLAAKRGPGYVSEVQSLIALVEDYIKRRRGHSAYE